MKRLAIAMLLAVMGTGCAGIKAYLPIINASLQGGKGVVVVTKDHTVTKEDLVGCYVTSALITALDTTQETVDSWASSAEGDKVIPAVDIDIAACHAMNPDVKPVVGPEVEARVQAILKAVLPPVTSVLTAVLESSEVNCRDLAIVKGVIAYLNNAAPEVMAELGNPDGQMGLPAVTLEFGSCDLSDPALVPPAAPSASRSEPDLPHSGGVGLPPEHPFLPEVADRVVHDRRPVRRVVHHENPTVTVPEGEDEVALHLFRPPVSPLVHQHESMFGVLEELQSPLRRHPTASLDSRYQLEGLAKAIFEVLVPGSNLGGRLADHAEVGEVTLGVGEPSPLCRIGHRNGATGVVVSLAKEAPHP